MRRNQNRRGVAFMEFALSMLVLVPLLLGTGVMGSNMIRSLQTIQVARDAGHMYARGVDFGQPGNRSILYNIGADLGLTDTPGTSSAVVILSSVTYVDKLQCKAVGAVDASDEPTADCTNYTKWVFTQRLTLGQPSIRASNFGTPSGVTIDSTTGLIPKADYVKKAGARASISGVKAFNVVNGVAEGLPSGQVFYLAEAASLGWAMNPYLQSATSYSWGVF